MRICTFRFTCTEHHKACKFHVVYPFWNPSHIKCSRISLASLQNELTHFVHGHNILLPTAEFLNAKARKLFTPCLYVLVCLHVIFPVKSHGNCTMFLVLWNDWVVPIITVDPCFIHVGNKWVSDYAFCTQISTTQHIRKLKTHNDSKAEKLEKHNHIVTQTPSSNIS